MKASQILCIIIVYFLLFGFVLNRFNELEPFLLLSVLFERSFFGFICIFWAVIWLYFFSFWVMINTDSPALSDFSNAISRSKGAEEGSYRL